MPEAWLAELRRRPTPVAPRPGAPGGPPPRAPPARGPAARRSRGRRRRAPRPWALRRSPRSSTPRTPPAGGSSPDPATRPKYTGTTWSLIVLEQLGADPADPPGSRPPASTSWTTRAPRPAASAAPGRIATTACRPRRRSSTASTATSLRALIAFGRLDDPRVAAAIDWEARAAAGGPDAPAWYASGTSGPGFALRGQRGAALRLGRRQGAARPSPRSRADRRTPAVERAIEAGVDLLLGVDPATAAYPAGWDGTISGAWFRLGFPSGYVADVLQVAEVAGGAGPGAGPAAGGRRAAGPGEGRRGGSLAQRAAVPGQAVVRRRCTRAPRARGSPSGRAGCCGPRWAEPRAPGCRRRRASRHSRSGSPSPAPRPGPPARRRGPARSSRAGSAAARRRAGRTSPGPGRTSRSRRSAASRRRPRPPPGGGRGGAPSCGRRPSAAGPGGS